MRFEMKVMEPDPFCLMCGDCAVDYIECWKEVSEQELKDEHSWSLADDACMSDQEKMDMADDFGWEETPENFDDYIYENIKGGYIRIVDLHIESIEERYALYKKIRRYVQRHSDFNIMDIWTLASTGEDSIFSCTEEDKMYNAYFWRKEVSTNV